MESIIYSIRTWYFWRLGGLVWIWLVSSLIGLYGTKMLIVVLVDLIETAADYTPCAPRWLYFTFAIGLFIYQSLDAIDGKQARRTGKLALFVKEQETEGRKLISFNDVE